MLIAEMIPQEPAQPSGLEFPVTNLFTLPRIPNRAQYKALLGHQAPPYDPSQPHKYWLDGAADPSREYKYLGIWNGTLAAATIPGAQAVKVNLPGEYEYPICVIAETPAMSVSPFSGHQQSLPAEVLSSKAEADALGAELGLPVVDISDVAQSVIWNGETRRKYVLDLDSSRGDVSLNVNVARLIRDRAQRGVGAPGGWFWSQQGAGPGKRIWLSWGPDAVAAHATPDWSPTNQDTGFGDLRPEVLIPCRPLAKGESIVQRSVAGATSYWIVKAGSSLSTGEGGGGLTSEQAAILVDNHRLLKAIAQKFGES